MVQSPVLTRWARVTTAAANPLYFTAFLAFAALAVTVLKTGIGIHPEWHRLLDGAIHWQDISQSPLLAEGDASLRSNVVESWLSGALGFQSPKRYLTFAMVLAAIAIVLPIALAYRKDNTQRVKLAFIFVAGGSLAPIALSWIGGYDAVSIITLITAVMVRKQWNSLIAWFVLAMNHAPVALLAFLAWVPIALVIWKRDATARIVTSALATIAGAGAMHVITNAWGGSTDRFALFTAIPFDALWHAYITMLPITVFSILGIGWIVLADRSLRRSTIGKVLIIESLAISLLIPLVAIDATRIAGMIALAPIFTWIAHAQLNTPATERIWRRTWLIAAIVPIFMVWQGTILHPGWGNTDVIQKALDGQIIRGL